MSNPPGNRRRVYEAFQKGRDPEQIVAYHGTSLSTLKLIVEGDSHPGHSCNRQIEQFSKWIRSGDVWVVPIRGRTEITAAKDSLSEDEAFNEVAIGYAPQIACEHYYLQRLGLPLDRMLLADLEQEFKETFGDNPSFAIGESLNLCRWAFEKVTKRSYSIQEILAIMNEACRKKGVVIGYGSTIFTKGSPLIGDAGNDVRVRDVTVEDIVGVEPLDQETYDYLEKLAGE